MLLHVANGIDCLQTLVSELLSINHSSAIFAVVKVAFCVFLFCFFYFAVTFRVRTFHWLFTSPSHLMFFWIACILTVLYRSKGSADTWQGLFVLSTRHSRLLSVKKLPVYIHYSYSIKHYVIFWKDDHGIFQDFEVFAALWFEETLSCHLYASNWCTLLKELWKYNMNSQPITSEIQVAIKTINKYFSCYNFELSEETCQWKSGLRF